MVTLRTRFNPLTTLAVLLVGAGLLGMMRGRGAADQAPTCDPGRFACADGARSATSATGERAARALPAAEACADAGYLCAELADQDRVRLRRWKDFTGTLVVHVPRPDFEDAAAALALQRAAAVGIRAWNNEPFPILVDTHGDREAHFAVVWSRSLGGNHIGVARTRWSPADGLSVVSIELATRSPYRTGQVADARQVRLTAAHEMGHALGLPHSDSRRDVMYPTNTATSVSAQDRRTMEVLYRLEDGTEILR